ncbi:Co2+/Mg2+ efflux protein ApaG [Cyclobacterium sp. 1_MG-2023]|uniref:Co2+/Mg2+ efflux protein ApaG n=1 Tax=Cyclobacterium sp. 1_MG-2023 TaxID=3062681 RepID=UPI0026E43D5D|nr:Co2+/Mg2+ efflux protein ApaG [Cyclobacterium sp. 1_MG-2023]MDO6436154.1 Co2+/Mg2+ efflux protein ApaG [Cyclobacterium sp. 1_MG-2023]
MATAITEGIKISVAASYQKEFSNPNMHHFVFTYKVTIQNCNPFTVQLLRRRWEIHDAAESLKLVEGEGVVGQQPVLEPGNSHTYLSGCTIKSGMGKMKGNFYVEKLNDGKMLTVTIPEFQLIANFFNN